MSVTKWMGTTAVLAPLAFVAACSGTEAKFSRDVKPILKEHCAGCHSASGKGAVASGFSVESYEAVMKGTKFGPVVVPGSSVSSTLQRLIEHKAEPAIHMPQGNHQLPEEKVELIRAWIDQGAKDN